MFFYAAAGLSMAMGLVFVTQLVRSLKAKGMVDTALDDLVSSAKQFDVPVDVTDGSLIAGNPLEKEQDEAAQALRECEIATDYFCIVIRGKDGCKKSTREERDVAIVD